MSEGLDGAVFLVTGAAGEIGGAVCAKLTASGANVVATDIRPMERRSDCLTLEHDVTSFDSWKAVESQTKARFGLLHGAVNAAGAFFTEKLENVEIEAWRRLQALNIESVFHSLRVLLPLLKLGGQDRKGGSSVINISSIGGLRGAPFNAPYSATKGAVRLLSKAAALEFAALKYPIRVNSLHPGSVATKMVGGINARYVELGLAESQEAAKAAMIARHPMGRLAEPEEIANAIAFLCSTESSFMTGSEVVVDGGFTAR